MGDTVKLRGDWHPENLASGRVVAPGEVFDRSALTLDEPEDRDDRAAVAAYEHDRRLVDDGLVIDAEVTPVDLQGDALQQRARDLGVEGRSSMSRSELRKAIAQRQAAAPPAEQPEPPMRAGGDV